MCREKAVSVASEGEPSEADVATELAAPVVESQSAADAEMAAALKWAAKFVWVPPPSPEPSRLDDWFLGSGCDSRPRSSPVPFFPEVHEELTKSWKAPLSARSWHANSPSLTTLQGGPARGYTEVPQVERAVAMHLCPQNAASWRGRPRLPSRACKFSSALVAKAYAASGQAASALHAIAILQVYQAKVLKDLHEGVPDPELLHELRSATDYALRATKVTAQALGRAMSTMVVQERHLWLNLAEMRDAEKVRFLDAPISQAGLFGETVEEFAQQFSTVKQQTEAIKHILPRRAASGPAQPTQQPTPAPRRGRPPMRLDPSNGPVLIGRWHRQPVLRPLKTLVRLQSVPEMGSPGKKDRLTCPDPHSTRGRALDSASIPLFATWQTATTWSIKEQFPSSLGTMHSTSDLLHDGWMLFSLSRTCGRAPPVLPYALRQRACSDDLPSRADLLHSSHGTNSLGRTASAVRGFSPPATRCPPSDGTPTLGTSNITPLRPLAENFLDWLNLPNPSRWLLGTIRLGYAIQFARRPPKFRGVLTTSVQGSNTAVLRAEIAVLLVKGTIETVPSAEMKKGFYSPYFIVPKKGSGLRPILDLRVLNRALLKLPFKIHKPFLRFAFEGRAYQYKALPFGLALSPRVFTKGNGHTHSQLSRRLANPSSLVGHGSQPFGPVGTSGQLRKEQTLPSTEDLFSRRRAGLGQYVCASLPRACTVSSEVCGNTQMRSPGGRGTRAHSRTDSLGGPLLAQQNLVLRPGAPGISPSLAHSSEEGPPFSGEGHNLAPAPRSLEPPPMVPGRDQEDFRDLSPSVVNTLLQARAPSTRRLYDLKWRIFVNWCSSHGRDPRICGIKSVLSFLQEGLDRHLSASTLKVHVAAISANHDLVGGRSVGKHNLIIRFLREARRLNPPRPHLIPSWDLAVVLQGLQQDPFEPLQSVELDALSLKTALLTALTSIKRVRDLQALSVNSSCLEFGPADSHVVLRPRPGYVPKVPTTPFRDQVVTLQAISSQEDDPNLTLLCPVRALRIYMERTQPFRRSEQLFVCYGGQQKGKAVSKQRISHWLVNAIRMAYQARGLPCPLEVRAHSTRGIAVSAALANGASLTDICRAAGWATPNTFARFYNLRMEPVSARVLNTNS
ncbi:hypothetical protein H4Q32_005770 [Labeo rohita]|uniref:Core-binding (CB) domain-containing protein n=1 Tax=Labeo rohita TaxID=84645 RepID=A0ABQ8LPE2_LABRO|nr:hypothetical protein H4Q32_005770 [Labeo rohita]